MIQTKLPVCHVTLSQVTHEKSEGGMKRGLKGFGQKVSDLFTKLVLSEPAAMEIGTPYNVQHVQHVQADAHSSTGFSVYFYCTFVLHLLIG